MKLDAVPSSSTRTAESIALVASSIVTIRSSSGPCGSQACFEPSWNRSMPGSGRRARFLRCAERFGCGLPCRAGRISPEFVEEVAERLSGAGVTLFFAGTTYAVVRTSVVENWPQITSKRLSADLLMVAQGAYDFSKLERLLPTPKQEEGDEGKGQDGG